MSRTPDPENVAAEGHSAETRALAAAGYLPMLFVLPLLLQREDGFCRFHALQSLVLLVALVLAWTAIQVLDFVLASFLGNVFLVGFFFRAVAWLVSNLGGFAASMAYLGLMIAGMVYAAAGQHWRIPVLGALADRARTRLFGKQ